MDELKGKTINIENLVDYQKDSVVSMEVIKKELGTVTLFAFDKLWALSWGKGAHKTTRQTPAAAPVRRAAGECFGQAPEGYPENAQG